jgi:quercetin dioxygenase-like cupin family protein
MSVHQGRVRSNQRFSTVTGSALDSSDTAPDRRKAHLPYFGGGLPLSIAEVVMQRTFTAFLLLAGLAAGTLTLAADRPTTVPLRSQPLADLPNKVADMITVEYAPGQSSPPHRHNAHVFVYVLEGTVVMGVKGKEPVTLKTGETFYESPSDIHTVSRNASATASAKFLVMLIHDLGASTLVPAPQEK